MLLLRTEGLPGINAAPKSEQIAAAIAKLRMRSRVDANIFFKTFDLHCRIIHHYVRTWNF
jgi:hypothetical protein